MKKQDKMTPFEFILFVGTCWIFLAVLWAFTFFVAFCSLPVAIVMAIPALFATRFLWWSSARFVRYFPRA